ncbi:UNVERIFIED_CONTAM: DUF6080 domain-containing protein [Prevotella sp. 15_C9]
MKAFDFLKIKKDERVAGAVFLLWQILLNALVIIRYYPKFSQPAENYYKLFVRNFHLSGFDPLTYCVVSDWYTGFDVHRHPLLAFFYYPAYIINHWLMMTTGINFVQFIVAFILIASSFYAFIILTRICRELIGIARNDAFMLSFLLFSFAHIMVAAVSPDHFILSLFMLLLTIYIAGKQIKNGERMKKGQTILLFLITAGISLNNGLKVFIANLFTRGKSFFRPANLIVAVLLPAALLWQFGSWEYKTYVNDSVKERKHKQAMRVRAEKERMFAAFKDTTTLKDSAEIAHSFQERWREHRKVVLKAKAQKPANLHTGKPISKKGFLMWTDVTTPRWKTVVENLFGESIQLHQKHTLEDVLISRPVIISYDWIWNYVAEGLILLLFIGGIWCGRHSKLLWMVLSFATLDMILHIGLGFGIPEVYIMSAHWIYVIPINIAFLLKTTHGKPKRGLRITLFLLTTYLMVYNAFLLIDYLYL